MSESDMASGEPSTALDDARLRFFLEHQEQIREWAALAGEVQEKVEGLLRELRVDLVDEPRVAELGIRIATNVSGEYPTGPALYRPAWASGLDETPDVAIAMGWDGRVDPAGVWPKTSRPYVGVLASHHSDRGRAIEASIRNVALGHINDEPKFLKGSHWIVYRPLAPNKDWWRDIPAWRAWLADQLLATWSRWAPLVDEAVAGDR
jgi:hypothetical protein